MSHSVKLRVSTLKNREHDDDDDVDDDVTYYLLLSHS